MPVHIFLSSNELFALCSHSCKWHALMSLHGILGPCTLFFCHTPSFTHNFHTHTYTISHTKLCHIHHFLCRTPSFTYHFVTHNFSHTTCFTSRSSTTSFVFPSFPLPSTTFVAHYWKKLTCGVIRSFNLYLCTWIYFSLTYTHTHIYIYTYHMYIYINKNIYII